MSGDVLILKNYLSFLVGMESHKPKPKVSCKLSGGYGDGYQSDRSYDQPMGFLEGQNWKHHQSK